MGITAIILTLSTILASAYVILLSLEWAAVFGNWMMVLAAAAVVLMLIACLKALWAVKTKNWWHMVAVGLILVCLLLILIFRDQLQATLESLWLPIGPGGLPSDFLSEIR